MLGIARATTKSFDTAETRGRFLPEKVIRE